MRQVLANQQLLGKSTTANRTHFPIHLSFHFFIHHVDLPPSFIRRNVSDEPSIIDPKRSLGSTMGSHQDLKDATDFIAHHRIVPIISRVVDGLESAEQGFELLKRGDQFGKVVIKLRDSGTATGTQAKL
jgi:NADPH:quinone reductase-like Zn-dependent oxidoreductase